MTSSKREEMFKCLEGKTIVEVQAHAINVVRLIMSDGSRFMLNYDEQHHGIGVLQVKELQWKSLQ